MAEAGKDAGYGAAAGTVLPGIGNVVGAGLGGLIGGLKDKYAAGKPVARPSFGGKTSPFYDNIPLETNPKYGYGYAPAANATNILVEQALQRMGIQPAGGTAQPLYASPYAGRASAVADALAGMTSRATASTPYESARSADISAQAIGSANYPMQRQLMMAEPGRMSDLINLLLQAYGLDASMFAGYAQGQTQARNIDTSAQAGRNAALGQIPIVGGLLAGVGA